MYSPYFTSLIVLILLLYTTNTYAQEGKALYHVYAQNGQYENAELLFNDSVTLYTVERKGMDPQNNFTLAQDRNHQMERLYEWEKKIPKRNDYLPAPGHAENDTSINIRKD